MREQFWPAGYYRYRLFRPERPVAEPFTIVMPPPNVTGSLHIGHALDNTLQDVLIRWRRMQGRDALWQPGTDHAGIATQMVVERLLASNNEGRYRRGHEQQRARRTPGRRRPRTVASCYLRGPSCSSLLGGGADERGREGMGLLRVAARAAAEAVDERTDQYSLAAVLYEGTVYDHPLHGHPETVAALTRDDLVAFYRACYTLHGSRLIAVGDLDPEAILREAEARFSSLPPGPPPRPEINPEPLPGLQVYVVDRPGGAQTELRLGHVGVPRTDPDYIPMIVLNTLVGGKFTSRINLNLRERHAYTYGASTRLSPRLGPGPFVVDVAVATASTGAAAVETLGELRRIREELVEPHELEETVSYVRGVFPYTFQGASDLARRLETLAVYGLPNDYYERYLERLPAITREELLTVAQRRIHPDHMAVVAVGPAEALVPQLETLGPVTVLPVPG